MSFCSQCGIDLEKLGLYRDFVHNRPDGGGPCLSLPNQKFQIRYKAFDYWVLILPYNDKLQETHVLCTGFDRAVYEFNKELKLIKQQYAKAMELYNNL